MPVSSTFRRLRSVFSARASLHPQVLSELVTALAESVSCVAPALRPAGNVCGSLKRGGALTSGLTPKAYDLTLMRDLRRSGILSLGHINEESHTKPNLY